MPGAILFFGLLSIVFLNEIEMAIQKTGGIDWEEVVKFPIARKSVAMIAGVSLFGILFIIEIKLFLSGKLYAQGIGYSGIVRSFIVILLAYLSVAHKVVSLREKKSPNTKEKNRFKKMAIIAAAILLLIEFLILQFHLIV